ncbi:hypothetical protein [Burkholderia multivorans]|uniref:hypothetical protein n=1 Tax=Burkholderia multivorans TaxID=87883 RepID=UPI0021C15FBD|nr:hypothetical protein [Burkholderia multivorans]
MLNTMCPCCGSASTKRLSLVCAEGTHTTNCDRLYVGAASRIGVLGGVSYGTSTRKSGLANRYAPPVAPSAGDVSSVVAAVVSSALFVGVAALVGLGWGAAGMAAIFLLVVVSNAVRDAHVRKTAVASYPAKLATWNRAFLCRRCEAIFDPETRKFAHFQQP